MANIQELLNQIMEARYGKDVRRSIHDSISLCYDEATGEIQKELIQSITENAARAEHSANLAAENADVAVERTNKAIESADLATQKASSAAISAQTAVNAAEEAIEAISQTTSDSTIAFTSYDCGPDGDHALYTVEKLTSGEKLKDLLSKCSRIVTNVRYLVKLLGNIDISALGDGTVTGAINAINEALSGKQNTVTGAASTITAKNLTASRVLVSNSSGKVSASSITSTKLGYLSDVTGNIQAQINNKNSLQTIDGHLIQFSFVGTVLKIYIDGLLAESFTQFRHFDSSITPPKET